MIQTAVSANSNPAKRRRHSALRPASKSSCVAISRWSFPQTIPIPRTTPDAVEQQLYEDQISTLARQYLRDLRRDADIETR